METQVAAALASFLPYLLRAGKRAGEEAADVLGTDAGRLAGALWGRLRDKILGNPLAKGAAEDVAADPEDQDALGALRVQLRKLLAEDASIRNDLAAVFATYTANATATGGGTAINQQASGSGVNIAGPNTGTIRTGR